MVRWFMIAAVSVAVLAFSPTAFAQQPSADADQAKAMLIKAIAAVKADKTKALDMFNRGEGGFLDRDIFPFCFNMSDGKLIATQTKQVLGSDVRTFKDATGRVFGPEVFGAAKENQISEVRDRTMALRAARSTIHHRKSPRRGRPCRYRGGRERASRWFYAPYA